MRLLKIEGRGTFSLIERVGKDIPGYAILSHTWGADEDEVSFRDIVEGTGQSKTGYRKIEFCAKQATKDQLQYIWIDTCCIDKSSSAEFSESINSMFRWYQHSAACYVYLADVSSTSSTETNLALQFQKSRWFTRGWTLQELLAPDLVEFFSSDGERIGNKKTMVQEIRNITKITSQALQGTGSLSQFSVDERMSWAQGRETKREEDSAYSLLGIFNVYMPVIYGEGREHAFSRLRREIEESLSGKWKTLPRTAADKVPAKETVGELHGFHVPFSLKGIPTGKFTDRPDDTKALERALLPQKQDVRRRMLVMHGLGGAGKTQLAANFARRNQRNFSSILWLDGTSKSSLKQSLAAFASRVQMGQILETSRVFAAGQGGDVDAVVRDLLRWMSMEGNADWLMVLDNVDRDTQWREDVEAYNVEEYLPDADHGSVLITTRLPHLGQLGERWQVSKVNEKQARSIFEAWYGNEVGQEGDELLRALDGLPLALAQAAAYMNETETCFSAYTRLYREQWKELMEVDNGKQNPLQNYANGGVATTWMISYTAIRKRNLVAANLLLLWAHLDNKNLGHGLLAIASQKSAVVAERTSAWLGGIARNELEFIKAIRMLRNYSLVEGTDGHMGYVTHPVVHQWALHIQDDSQRVALSWLAIVLIGFAVPTDIREKSWELQSQLLSHAEQFKSRTWEAVNYLFGEDWMKEQEEERRTLVIAIHMLGSLYSDQGNLAEAERLFLWALGGYEKALDEPHGDRVDTGIFNTANDLGNLYSTIGQWNKAEKMFVRALEGKERALGMDCTSTLETVNNLGNLYNRQGNHIEAQKLYLRALEGYEKENGPDVVDHIPWLNTAYNLGYCYTDLEQPDKAEDMYLRALKGYSKTLGGGHRLTLDTALNLGHLYMELGRLDEAEKTYMGSLEQYDKATGQKSILTSSAALETMVGLGVLRKCQNRVEETRELYSNALAGYQQMAGDDHPRCAVLRARLETLAQEDKAGREAEGRSVQVRSKKGTDYTWRDTMNPMWEVKY